MKKEICLLENIEIERVRRKMSMEYVTEVLAIPVSTYEGWLTGEIEIPSTAIIKLARLRNVSSYLLGGVSFK